MTNEYKIFLETFFTTILEYKHTTKRLNDVLIKDSEKFTELEARYHSASSLVISDWTGETDNGWEKVFHTGISVETEKENYALEIHNVLSREFCLIYSQSFESFEKFLKDCVFFRSFSDENFKSEIEKTLKKTYRDFSRENMPSGDNLFKLIKKIDVLSFEKYSHNNNINIEFDSMWKVLSEVRHSITHSKSVIKLSKVKSNKHQSEIFDYFFDSDSVDKNTILIRLDYKKFKSLMDRFSEFAFQIFKIISEKEKLEIFPF